ncbi:MAG: nickel pincer cofactor biosynthesis protein LarB [Clostridiales bacterium]|nr:nickel pincer cofactor biosynthesis protein LarB [Clostridiales bacterium]
MKNTDINHILERLISGELTIPAASALLKRLMTEDMGYARPDYQREERCGFPEVIFGAGKTPAQVAQIMARLAERHGGNLLATRCEKTHYAAVRELLPAACFDETSRIIYLRRDETDCGLVAVLAAGTSDLPVAEEAALTASLMGARVERLYDVGVSGLHRLLACTALLQEAKAAVVVAGMEGALASVAGGLTAAPVIAVPTSIGYGASFGGLAALLAMLNSCCAGVAVVNIDNGFGAGYMAAVINKQSVEA